MPRIVSWPQPVFCENVTEGASAGVCSDGLSPQALDTGWRDGTDREGNLLHVAFARPGGRDDRGFHQDHAQGQGDGDPFAGLHADVATRPLEAAQLRGNLIVAFRKALKREVAGRAGFRRAGCDATDRHLSAWQGGTRLVSDRPGRTSHGLRAGRNGRAPQHQARGQRKPHSQMGRCISSADGSKETCRVPWRGS